MQNETAAALYQEFGRLVVPVDDVRTSYFSEYGWDTFRRKLFSGALKLPCLQLTEGQKAKLYVDVRDLADYLDARRDAARRDLRRKSVV
ncbi:pyocin activator PrtN family protein [Ponticoccus litoralis]|uniref:Pyocin activator PrtN family protein n=1 Tax=Ponticoccus litoralis TaxID=422297 RepID=A0AAW9SMU7_9RHOB